MNTVIKWWNTIVGWWNALCDFVIWDFTVWDFIIWGFVIFIAATSVIEFGRTATKSRKASRDSAISYSLILVAYPLIQMLFSNGDLSRSIKGQLVPICVYIVMAISLNLTVGILGELSLGHAGFMCVGAFTGVTTCILLADTIPSEPLRLIIAMVVGGAAAAVVGALVGLPVLRLRGDYLAIVTLAFCEIIKVLFQNFYLGVDDQGLHFSLIKKTFELGENGRLIIDGPSGIPSSAMSGSRIATFGAGVLLILFTLFVVLNLINSRHGRAIMAVRDNKIAADSIGISTTRYKLLAFVTSAALAGMAGALYATNYSTSTADKFDFNLSILVLVFVVLGGLGNIWGSMIAAALLTLLPEWLRDWNLDDWRMLVYAILLIVLMLFNNSKLKKTLLELWNAKKTAKTEGEVA